MKDSITFIIVPHDNSRTRNYRISYRLLYTFSALSIVFILALAFFIASYGRIFLRAQLAARLQEENEQLLLQNARIDSLTRELVRLQAMSIQVKRMLGVDLSRTDSLLVAKLSPLVKSPAISGDAGEGSVGRKEQELLLKAVPSMWPVKGYVTRGFHTTGGEKSADYHPGIDIAAKKNTPIKACAEGVVVTSAWDDTYGYIVVIDHGFGIYSLYGHNSRNLVKVGDRVIRGQVIAFLGSTGRSSGPHLHFEVRKNGLPVNPMDYLLD